MKILDCIPCILHVGYEWYTFEIRITIIICLRHLHSRTAKYRVKSTPFLTWKNDAIKSPMLSNAIIVDNIIIIVIKIYTHCFCCLRTRCTRGRKRRCPRAASWAGDSGFSAGMAWSSLWPNRISWQQTRDWLNGYPAWRRRSARPWGRWRIRRWRSYFLIVFIFRERKTA